MRSKHIVWALSLLPSTWALALPQGGCRCIPGEACWPSDETWDAFNSTVDGKLIKSVPLAKPCYTSTEGSGDQCQNVNNAWSTERFQTAQALGRFYPFNTTCPPVANGQQPGTCSLGQLPVYVVRATEHSDVEKTLGFVQDHNIRLSITNTGHDLNGRGDGFGSLGLWVQNLRKGLFFHESFKSATQCTESGWNGKSIHIDGAYQWGDVYGFAEKHNVIVVGGGSSSVGATGGWLSGGGHGPASRNYGLGADQLLEAEVMLANGTVVVANHCQHADLFRALRGGGPGYGVVLGVKVKAYPNVDKVTAHHLTIAPSPSRFNTSALVDAVSIMMQSFPALNERGYAGYATWFRYLPGPYIANSTSAYTHSFWTIGMNQADASAVFEPLRRKLADPGLNVVINSDFQEYNDYWSFFHNELDKADIPGDTLLLTSRMLDKKALHDFDRVRHMVEVVSGRPQEYTMNLAMLVSGGKVFADAADTSSGLNPAWRTSPVVLLTGRKIPKTQTLSLQERQAIAEDMTSHKGQATKELAPDTAGYMSEGDGNDPDYINSFYGSNYAAHLAAKDKYDPKHVFYCRTCVGAERFISRPEGALCKAF
ncbi:hypothetical protein ED733_003736 [Metarhizium rileyi]|uniref:FAD-binding PCMH-type domain-containing protein n=1 Tax=Metarhizium rileyi (strain RCEF 4871) TaxID=1649241 RepID=A0A5C6GB64_METRR|nr:hypothetical protein ED733_003736 [Metarhizium rileyi]